jgi:hypothetical protein
MSSDAVIVSSVTDVPVKLEKQSSALKKKRNLLMSSYIKPRRKRRRLISSDCRTADEEEDMGDIKNDDTYQVVTTETGNSTGLQSGRGGIKLSIRRSSLQLPIKIENDGTFTKLQKGERIKKCPFWNWNSLKSWGTKIKRQQMDVGSKSRPSTRSQTAAIQHQELTVARMKSDEIDSVSLSVLETASTVSIDVTSRRSSLRSQDSSDGLSSVTEQSRTMKHSSKNLVIQRYLRRNNADPGCGNGETREIFVPIKQRFIYLFIIYYGIVHSSTTYNII